MSIKLLKFKKLKCQISILFVFIIFDIYGFRIKKKYLNLSST